MANMDLAPDALKAMKKLCQRYRVRELSIFGSALREDFRADSDIDLLVDLNQKHRLVL